MIYQPYAKIHIIPIIIHWENLMECYKFINESIVKQLISDIGEEDTLKILTSFIDEAQTHLQHIEKAVTQTIIQDLQASAHALKGAAGMIGALQLQSKLLEIEKACHDNKKLAFAYAANIQSTVTQTVAEIHEIIRAVHKQPYS